MRRGTKGAEQFGAIVHVLRINHSLTMRQVSNVIGCAPAFVSQVERAQRVVQKDAIPLWAEALGISEQYLLKQWNICNKWPAPPIVRTRRKSPEADSLMSLISSLSAADRNRVLGYVEALLGTNTEV